MHIMDQSLEESAQNACASIGVNYKDVPADGRFHSADLINDPRGRGDGRIKVFPDRQGGIVWNHKSGERQFFFVNQNNGAIISDQERERIKADQRRREVELKQRQDRAANKLLRTWEPAIQAPPDHPYLAKKVIEPHGARTGLWERFFYDDRNQRQKLQIENCLLLPLFNESGVIRNLQAIFPNESPELGRSKDFFPGAELTGLFWWIGAKSDPVCVAEGFSTSATVHEETGYRVYISFTANNLKTVGKIVRRHLPNTEIIFCADNDANTSGNPGVTKATQAAAEVGGYVAIPPVPGDFNDYAMMQGAKDNEQ